MSEKKDPKTKPYKVTRAFAVKRGDKVVQIKKGDASLTDAEAKDYSKCIAKKDKK